MNEQTAGQTAQAARQAAETERAAPAAAPECAAGQVKGASAAGCAAGAGPAARAAQAGAVDMVATARAVQQEADGWGGPGLLKLIAPAKVNLFLGIGPRRSDDYHEATSILHAIALHDVLYVRRAPTPERLAGAGEAALAGPVGNVRVGIECIAREGLEPLPVPAAENIVFRAVDALACELGREDEGAVEIRLEKHIPYQAGLGGGSSDAAAALLGMAHVWGVAPDDPVLERVARRLGSDVAFFLHGGCACFGGAGERFDHALAPMKKSLVLVKPTEGMSTAAAYRSFDEDPRRVDEDALAKARQAACALDVPLFNNLAPASERLMPELEDVKAWVQAQPGVEDALLCGSGSTTFAVVESLNAACRLTAAAQAKGWWARSTTFGSLRAALVP